MMDAKDWIIARLLYTVLNGGNLRQVIYSNEFRKILAWAHENMPIERVALQLRNEETKKEVQ